MSNPSKVSRLFTKAPRQWNLRGDPWLWQDLKQNIETAKPPANADEFVVWLESEFEQLVGVPLWHADIVFLKKIQPRWHVQRLHQPPVLARHRAAVSQKNFADQQP